MAVGWTLISCEYRIPDVAFRLAWRGSFALRIAIRGFGPGPRAVHKLACDRRLGNALVADKDLAFHANGGNPPGFHFHFNTQLISRKHRTTESGALDSGENHQLVSSIFDFGEQQCAAGLGNRFDDQHSWHDWQVWEMAGKERLIYGDILDGDDALFSCDLYHTVDHQKRKAVGQDAENVIDVQCGPGWRFGGRVSVAHWVTVRSEDYTVPRCHGLCCI